jgi:hypothetical protein
LPSDDEVAFASGSKEFTGQDQAEYLKAIEAKASTLASAFLRQERAAAVPFDSSKFERYLTEWMVACDQPFDEVERPEFICMMNYLHHSQHPQATLNLPDRKGIRRRVMKLGEETIAETRDMFKVSCFCCLCTELVSNAAKHAIKDLIGKVSLSLDAWTSSNCIAFLAIVAHYVSNDGKLGMSYFCCAFSSC